MSYKKAIEQAIKVGTEMIKNPLDKLQEIDSILQKAIEPMEWEEIEDGRLKCGIFEIIPYKTKTEQFFLAMRVGDNWFTSGASLNTIEAAKAEAERIRDMI